MKAPNEAASDVLVLVGDARRARVLRPGAGDTLDVVWEAYAATAGVRSLGQAPDLPRRSDDATPPPPRETNAEFARDVAGRLKALADEGRGPRVLMIAPQSFASALEAELGAAWPVRAGDVIHRDETNLDDAALHAVIASRLNANANARSNHP